MIICEIILMSVTESLPHSRRSSLGFFWSENIPSLVTISSQTDTRTNAFLWGTLLWEEQTQSKDMPNKSSAREQLVVSRHNQQD